MTRSTRLLLWTSVLGLFLVVLAGVAAVLLVNYRDIPALGDPVPLIVRLEGEIPDGPGSGGFVLDPQDQPALLTEYTQVLRAAAQDANISELVLDIHPLAIGWGRTQELATAIRAFHDTGKRCVAVSDTLTNKEYLLAAACGEIHLAPGGLFLVNGLSLTQTYYLGTLDKLGVVANIEHVGEYKSAVEPFQRTGPSEPAQEAVNAMLDGIFDEFVRDVAVWRERDEAEVRALVDEARLTPQAALDAGLIEEVSYRRDLLNDPAYEDAEHFGGYLDTIRAKNQATPCVAVVHANGTIVSGDEGDDSVSSGDVSDGEMVALLEDLAEDDDVLAVVLRVDSPGGSGLASDNIWRALQALQETKPVVVSMADVAASGGYFIATGASTIVAQPDTLTGSIGVFGGKANVRGLLEQVGLTLFTYNRGAQADLLSMTHDFSDPGRERFREFLQTFYDLFLQRVADGRSMTVEQVDALARGRVWTGRQALENGLVDELGGLEEAMLRARELAEITETTGIRHLPREKTLVEEIMASLDKNRPDDASVQALADLVPGGRDALDALLSAEAALRGNGVAALLPVWIEIR